MILNLNSSVVKALMAVGRAGHKTAENYAGSDMADSTQIPFQTQRWPNGQPGGKIITPPRLSNNILDS